MMALIKMELCKTFDDQSVVRSDGFLNLFELAWPTEKVSDAFEDWCRKCDVFVTIQAIPDGWSFFMNNIKVMERFTPTFSAAACEFRRQIVVIMFKSEFIIINSLPYFFEGAKFVSFHESRLNDLRSSSPRGLTSYDLLCR